MVGAVPQARRGVGLLAVDALGEADVEAQEVDELARGVDLGLGGGLGLAEHGRAVEDVAVGPGDELGGPQEDRGAVGEGHAHPVGAGGLGGGHGVGDLGVGGLPGDAQDVAPVVGLDDLDFGADAAPPLARDVHVEFELRACELGELLLEALALGVPGA
ncbi:hypothetical protein GCM10029992_02620 [Glycomyces albus]